MIVTAILTFCTPLWVTYNIIIGLPALFWEIFSERELMSYDDPKAKVTKIENRVLAEAQLPVLDPLLHVHINCRQ